MSQTMPRVVILGCDVLWCVSLCLDMELVVGYVECSFPIAFRADRGMNGPVPWGSGKEGRGGRSSKPERFRRLTTPFFLPPPLPLPSPHTQHYRPHFLVSCAYQSHPEGREILIHTLSNDRDERGAACSRLLACLWSAATLHVEPKKNRESNTEIFHLVPRYFFSLVTMGPIKEPCEGPLEKASFGNSSTSV